uniref:hypothetical protein n=1 Tax=Rhodococcus ruber TaxID=1830 RepID=UPI0037848D32
MAWSRPTIVSGLTRATKALFDTYADAIDEAHEALDGRLSEADLNATYAPVLGATGYAPRDLASFVTDGDSRTQLNGNVSTDAASASGT